VIDLFLLEDYIMRSNQVEFYKAVAEMFPDSSALTVAQLIEVEEKCGRGKSFITTDPSKRVSRGMYDVSAAQMYVAVDNTPKNIEKTPMNNERMTRNTFQSNIPTKYEGYVKFGNFSDVKVILMSKLFYPIFITGESGNGKTMMVEQVCAELKRELYRVNFTPLTDESDLLGDKTLIDGNVVFEEGAVITAMKRGAVLLLDEIDYATAQGFTVLQSVLEGKPFLNKKTGEVVTPAEGFTVIATANTKGKGSDDGRFVGTQFLNEAFLERFAITIEQQYPSRAVERKILVNELTSITGEPHELFANNLVDWADAIRKTFADGGSNETMSTRRLVHIIRAFAMFKDRMKAVKLCVARFDNETRDAFVDLYTKIDADVSNSISPTAENDDSIGHEVSTNHPF
jgi:MoxR-like ATPase